MPKTTAEIIKTDLGRRIAEIRVARGMSQEAFSVLIHTSPNRLSEIENGGVNLTLDSIAKFMDALEVAHAVELFMRPNEGEPPPPRRMTRRRKKTK